MIDSTLEPIKRGVGRPRRRTPGERVHITLGSDVMAAVRNDSESSGRAYSALIERVLIAYYQRKNQQHKTEII